ncbi:MAG: HIT domain-containing protein [Proteobacteria bacterium]|nr:HIT domain-containing protein [Pseudomonadota bacterium]
MTETIFARILRGEVPCHRVYEDAQVLAFLDVNPLAAGHLLVIPKEPAVTLDVLSDDAAAALGRVLPRLCRALIAVTGAPGYNVLQNNGSVAHQAVQQVHFHLIPKPDAERGLGVGWPAGRLDGAEGATLAARLAAAVAATAT